MKKNGIWVVLFIIIAGFALLFIGKAAYSVLDYSRLAVKVPTKIEKWSVEEIKADQFGVYAHYTYEFAGKNFKEVGRVGGYFPNPWAAEKAKEQFAKKDWPAWLNPKHPEKAFLVKKFPFKKIISALILVGLLIYFLFLSYYVKVKNS